jgi:hypothetical protein
MGIHDRDWYRDEPENRAFGARLPNWVIVVGIVGILVLVMYARSRRTDPANYSDTLTFSEYEKRMPFFLALQTGDVDTIRSTLARNPEFKEDVFGGNTEWGPGGGALTLAISLGNVESVRAVLDCDVDINQADDEGRTPLHFAAGKGSGKWHSSTSGRLPA